MSNARFSILQARAVEDKRISNAQFRTLAALGMFGDKNGWCFPKLRTLAEILGKSRQAVNHDIQALAELGYVEVYHQFRDDGSQQHNKYRLIFDNDTPRKAGVYPPSTPEIYPPSISEVYPPSISEVDALTPQVNAPINAPNEVVVEEQRPNIYGVYEAEIGAITPMLAQMLDEIEKSYPVDWFAEAVKEAKRSTTRVTLKYVEKIMQRWKADGKAVIIPNKNKPPDPSTYDIVFPQYGGDK